jgi:hypothetical protein
MEKNP